MHRFYVEDGQICGDEVRISGSDVNHIKNVLRMKENEEIIICNGQGKDFHCIISQITSEEIIGKIQSIIESNTELGTKIYLFQGLPKKDKMELIIQKAVELGVHEIIPVITKRTIVKLDDSKKEQKKIERWQGIATSAGKQSSRGIIPQVIKPMSYQEALNYATTLDYNIIPYEKAENIDKTREIIQGVNSKNSVGIFIGPEGGFEENEIEKAMDLGIKPITLGRRILRTETAGFTILSIIMFELER